jgi:hypothetical protein
MKGVKELSKMKNLWRLHMKFERNGVDEKVALTLVVHAAGKVPNLKKFEYEMERSSPGIDEDFVIQFGSLYKNKEICLSKLRSGKLFIFDHQKYFIFQILD